MGHVRLYGERGRGGAERDGHHKTLTREQECRQKPPGLKIEGRNPETRRNTETKKTHTPGDACRRVEELNDYRGGRRLLRPSTHTQAKYHHPHRSGTNLHTGRWNPGEGIGQQSTGEVRRRSPPDGRRATRRCWRGRLTD